MGLSEKQLKRMATDLPYFLKKYCFVEEKDSSDLVPFKMNKPQSYIYEMVMKQLAEEGKVRALWLKSRQQGSSTLAAAMTVHNGMFNPRSACKIYVHKYDALKEFKDQTYMALLRNMKLPDFSYDQLFSEDSQDYKVFAHNQSSLSFKWASGLESARGSKSHYVHCSEAAYYDLADEKGGAKLIAALLQSVPPNSGHLILESTSYGRRGKFYEMWNNPDNGFIKIFCPWFWSDEYRITAPPGFQLDDIPPGDGEMSEVEYAKTYGLDDDQMCFRRQRIAANGLSEWKREFPATASEAFSHTEADSFIPAPAIYKGLQEKTPLTPDEQASREMNFPLICGVDMGGRVDRTIALFRRGPVIEGIYVISNHEDRFEVAQELANVIRRKNPDQTIIDDIGVGWSVDNDLRRLGCSGRIYGVNVSNTPMAEHYANLRAEAYHKVRDFFTLENGLEVKCFCPADLRQQLMDELLALRATRDGHQRWKMRSKEEIKKELKRSPDIADALMLTFAEDEPLSGQFGRIQAQERNKLRVNVKNIHDMGRRMGPQGNNYVLR